MISSDITHDILILGRVNTLSSKTESQTSEDDWEGRVHTTSQGIYYDTSSIWGGSIDAVTSMIQQLNEQIKKGHMMGM